MTIDQDRSKDARELASTEPKSESRSLPVPPVLFTLRKLADPQAQQLLQEDRVKSSFLAETDAEVTPETNHVAEVAFNVSDGPFDEETSREPLISDEMAQPNSEEKHSYFELEESQNDNFVVRMPVAPKVIPAKRKWTERIGSNGIVIGLLLSVVAAALLTGNTNNKSTPEQADLLSFDDRAVDLPFPEMIEIDLGQAEGSKRQLGSADNDPAASDPIAGQSLTAENQQDISPIESETLVDLSDPNASTGEDAVSEKIEAESTVAMADIAEGDSLNEALPSLEQLTEIPTNTIDDLVSQPESVASPVQTATPRQINDWLKYLPPIERVASEPSNLPSTIK